MKKQNSTKIYKAYIHQAEEGGFWAEIPEIIGCMTQGETLEQIFANMKEALTGCLSELGLLNTKIGLQFFLNFMNDRQKPLSTLLSRTTLQAKAN